MQSIKGNIVDINSERIFAGEITFDKGRIVTIKELADEKLEGFIIPGFVDAHVHIESSMLIPSQFARLAVVHGTVATVSDPHEIANVNGMEGVEFMIADGKRVPFKFNFGAPSCVPATIFETAGAKINADDVEVLLQKEEVRYLSEMMNFPGVIFDDPEVLRKIAVAKKYNKPVDGHAPGLSGDDLKKYISAGISTDHECFTAGEALEKLQLGMKVLIREGSAAKNFEALIGLLGDFPDAIMFCSDDKHPDSLVDGHINELCARAIAKGIDVFKVLKAACVNPVLHYKLEVGLLKVGDAADFVVVEDLQNFKALETYINGMLVADRGKSLIETPHDNKQLINHFNCFERTESDFLIRVSDFPAIDGSIPVIEALDGQLITNKLWLDPKIDEGKIISDTDVDILKMVVVNRYRDAPVAKAFIRNFGFKSGAIASTVAHDSHNIVAVGVDDTQICRAVNALIKCEGGVSCVSDEGDLVLPLPVAGLMSAEDGYKVAEDYKKIDAAAKSLGSSLASPFMTLSFMSLLVIPELKLSDKGLFDGKEFKFM